MLSSSGRALSGAIVGVCLAAAALSSGCGDFDLFNRNKDLPPEPKPQPLGPRDPILADTVGDRVMIGDAAPQPLRGFGVVIGLGETGGGDCPTAVREYLIDYLGKQNAPRGSGPSARISPQRLLDSPDAAVVAVYGFMPAGARKGTVIDVRIEALGTQTKSLSGGTLLPTELKVFDISSTGQGIVSGRAMGVARGPIFTNTTSGRSTGISSDERRGLILGGGRTLEDRSLQLLITEPSYATARSVEQRINEKFGQSPPTAKAVSQGRVSVEVPPGLSLGPARMAEIITHLPLDSTPAGVERRIREMSTEAGGDATKMNHLSLVWEGIGRGALPQIQTFYSNADPVIAYYAARAGLRLKDGSALPIVSRVAESAGSPQRLEAIRELGSCGQIAAAGRLTPLLNVPEQEIRIAAYEALTNFRHSAIRSRRFPHPVDSAHPNMILDVVESTAAPIIYVKRSREPRIAIIGPTTPIIGPLYYNHPRDWLTVTMDKDPVLTLFCRTRQSGRLSDHIKCAPRVVDLIVSLAALPIKSDAGKYPGLGLWHSLIVECLGELCAEGHIPATFVLEAAPPLDAAPTPGERPETDEDAPADSRSEVPAPTERPE